jgi:hypothetical protein
LAIEKKKQHNTSLKELARMAASEDVRQAYDDAETARIKAKSEFNQAGKSYKVWDVSFEDLVAAGRKNFEAVKDERVAFAALMEFGNSEV